MKRMLINATQPEELRVAIVDGQKLYNLDIESPGRERKKANIYKGRITRIEPSLEAAFVDYGAERHGFLPLKEVARGYFDPKALEKNRRPGIAEALHEGQEIVVQVEKEERGNKGAALTTFVSLAGRFLVLMPNNPRAGGVSRRIEGQDRQELKQAMSQLEVPEGMGLIVRTAGVGKNVEELQWDLDYLLQLWQAIEKAAAERKAPFLIYQESNVIIRSMRDYLRADIHEILIDNPEVYDEARRFIEQVMPRYLNRLKLYQDEVPLFSRYQIESQIETAFQREVRLPSGGSIVIDHTEALTSIDINSARATKGADIEDTALTTNLEASEEIARQLRLRDLGGLFVIDYIDMGPSKHQRQVEQRLREAMKEDRARVQIGRISRFGLLEMSRQRLRPSLGESAHQVCPRCKGQGYIRDVESLSLSILRIIEEEALKENTGKVQAQLPVDVATFLLNEKRQVISEIEQRHGVTVTLIPNRHLETPHYSIERIRSQDLPREAQASYRQVEEPETVEATVREQQRKQMEQPAVKNITPATPVPQPSGEASTNGEARKPEGGFIKRLFSIFTAVTDEIAGREEAPSSQVQLAEKQTASERDNGRRRANNRNRRSGNRKKKNEATPPAEEQSPKQTQTEANQQETTNSSGQPQNNGEKPSTTRRNNRRGRRGGRGRGRGRQARTQTEHQVNEQKPATHADQPPAAATQPVDPPPPALPAPEQASVKSAPPAPVIDERQEKPAPERKVANPSSKTQEQSLTEPAPQPTVEEPRKPETPEAAAATPSPAETKQPEPPQHPSVETPSEAPSTNDVATEPTTSVEQGVAPPPEHTAAKTQSPAEAEDQAPKPEKGTSATNKAEAAPEEQPREQSAPSDESPSASDAAEPVPAPEEKRASTPTRKKTTKKKATKKKTTKKKTAKKKAAARKTSARKSTATPEPTEVKAEPAAEEPGSNGKTAPEAIDKAPSAAETKEE